MVGRTLGGLASSPAYPYEQLADWGYDYLVLNSADDPRTYGLLQSDAIHTTPYWTIYRDAPEQRLTANDIAAALGSLDVPSDGSVRLGLRDGRLATGADVQPADQPIVFGIVSPARGVIEAGPAEVTVNPGLTWITAPPIPGSVLEVSATGPEFRPHIVAARLQPSASGQPITTEHVARHVISVDVHVNDGALGGAVITMNPTGTGGNVGMAYAESPRNDASPSHGFWSSAGHITAPAQRNRVSLRPNNPHPDGNR